MEQPLHIVEPAPDPDTVATLTSLLEQAKAGRMVGVAYVAMYRGGRFDGDVLGLAREDQIRTLGLISALQLKIANHLD